MRRVAVWLLVATGMCAGVLPASADLTVHGDRFDAVLPDGFRPTAGAFAREAAAPLRELLGALGAEAMGARRVRYDVLGAAKDPEATFVARSFAMRPPEADVLGSITDRQLAEGWARFTTHRQGHVAAIPRRRTVSGLPSHELGGVDALPGGELRWTRYLLLSRGDEVLVLAFTATGTDTKPWEEAWERLVRELHIEKPVGSSMLLQGIALGTALGCLFMAALLRFFRRRAARARASLPVVLNAGVPVERVAARPLRGMRSVPDRPQVAEEGGIAPGATALELAVAQRLAREASGAGSSGRRS